MENQGSCRTNNNDEIILMLPDPSIEDEDNEEDSDSEILPKSIEINSFIFGSNAFRDFVTDVKLFLLPQKLRPVSRIVMTIPRKSIWFSDKEDLSLSNKFKAFAEQTSNAKWRWWPLRPRMRLLQKDETRMHWLCVSGTKANSRFWMTTKSSSTAAGIFGPRCPPLMQT